MAKDRGPLDPNDVKTATDAIEPFLKQFGIPIIEWLAQRTGEERAWIGAFILSTCSASMLAWMMMDEPDEDERKRVAGLIAQHFNEEIHRVIGYRDALYAPLMNNDEQSGAPMTYAQRVREEAAKFIVRMNLERESILDEGGRIVPLHEAIRAMPLPEPTEGEREILTEVVRAHRYNKFISNRAMADAVLAWLREGK